MMKRIKYILVFIVGVLYSCQDMDYMNEGVSPVVVSGVLFPQEIPVITLNLLGDIDEVSQVPVVDAKVSVYSDDKLYDFSLADDNQGAYIYSGNDFEIIAGNKYQLEINYRGSALFAETIIPYPVKDVGLEVFVDTTNFLGNGAAKYISVNWDSPDNSYYYITLECDSLSYSDCNYFCSPSFPFFEKNWYIDTDNLIYGKYYKLIVYSMTEEYAEYYYGSSDNGYAGNIENGYGIFTGINFKSVTFQYLTDSVSVVSK